MNDETTLIPCPWCSEYPKIAEDGGSTGPWFCVWHDCPPVEGGKARHYGESLGCISITTAWFHTEAEAIAAWNTRTHGTLTAELVEKIVDRNCEWYEGGEIDVQAIVDELNAVLGSGKADTDDALALLDEIREAGRISYDDYSQLFDAIAELGSGTCDVVGDYHSDDDYMLKLSCGHSVHWPAQNYCPSCGKRIRKAVER